MVLLIILAITGYIIFGYFIMNKIDIFIEKDVINTGTDYVDKKSTGGKSLLLFGNNELAKSVVKYCNDKDIELKFIEYYNEQIGFFRIQCIDYYFYVVVITFVYL
jgi:hypothetical protein